MLHRRFVPVLVMGAVLLPGSSLAATPSVSAGPNHNLALHADGTVFAWGDDANGQLGQGRAIYSVVPVQAVGASGIAAISAGDGYVLALTRDGRVRSWGKNDLGQLGDGTTASRSTPGTTLGLANVVSISAGGSHATALKSDGTVWTWGSRSFNPSSVSTTPSLVAGLSGVIGISTGGYGHTVALKGDGIVWTWGANQNGQLGNESSFQRLTPAPVGGLANVVAVAAGYVHTLALRSDGTVWSWGGNTSGSNVSSPAQLAGLSGIIAIEACDHHSLALKLDGTVWAWGRNLWGELGHNAGEGPAAVAGVSGAVAIACGFAHSAALRADGSVRTWGRNSASFAGDSSGALGDGTTTDRASPVTVTGLGGVAAIAAGAEHTVALRGDGTVWGFGLNTHGALADGGTSNRSTPGRVTALGGVAAIAAGGNHSVALKADGSVWTWGGNYSGELGNGSLARRGTPGQVAGFTNGIAIAAGGFHTVALRSDGSVWAWGATPFGGNATLSPQQVATLPGVVAIAASNGHTLALLGDGRVQAWGQNSFGQLGDGTTTSSPVPVLVGGLTGVVAVAAGGISTDAFSLALKGDGTVWAWGAGGSLGDGTFTNRLTPAPIAGLTQVVAIATRGVHSYAIKADGSVWAWGRSNFYGQLGDGTTTDRPLPTQLFGLDGVALFAPGLLHTIALMADGTVRSWGRNNGYYGGTYYNGMLGDGTYVGRSRPGMVVARDGAGSLDGGDWYLDLAPAQPDAIPPALVPRALAVSRLSGTYAINLDSTVKYKSAEFGSAVGNYVLGLVPPAFFDLVKRAPGSATSGELRAKAGESFVLAQLTPLGWTNVQGELIAYSHAVATAAGGAASILNAFNINSIPGARFCVGYGETADAMLGAQALREVLVLEGASATAAGVPCVLAGVYVGGPATSLVGTPATFSAAVVGLSPTGVVQFKDGASNLLAPVALTVANEAVGHAAVTTSALALGPHQVGADYSGDAQNPPRSAQSPLTHDVRAGAAGGSSVAVTGPASSQLGDEVAFSAAVTGNNPGGSVQFRDGTANLGAPQPLVNGVAVVRLSTLGVGSHSIAAAYSGDGSNPPGTSAVPLAHTVSGTPSVRVSLASNTNPAAIGIPIKLTADVSGNNPGGSVTFFNGAEALGTTSLANTTASTTISGLAAGAHLLTARYSGDANNQAVTSATLVQQVTQTVDATPDPFAFRPVVNVSPGSIVTSNAITVAGTNTAVPIEVSGGAYSVGCGATFTTAAGTVTSGQGICVRHTASGAYATATDTTLTIGGVSATFTSTTHTQAFAAGVGSMVTHYYQSILGRASDPGGQAFWSSEAVRLAVLGANVNEAFFALAITFYGSSEYAGFNRSNSGFVTDLYLTFFNRAPDGGGAAYWTGQLSQGLPREVLLASFMFSGEFASFTQAIFGNTAARAEVDTVMDFYRGLLGRPPDTGGFDHWVGKFRAAQCQGAAAIIAEVESISSQFVASAEYVARNRNNAQYVGDLYNAFLRRGGELGGVLGWIDQIATGALTRDGLRVKFKESPEFQGRVNAIIAQGCMSIPSY